MPITQAALTFASQYTVPQLIGWNFVPPFSSLERRKRFFLVSALTWFVVQHLQQSLCPFKPVKIYRQHQRVCSQQHHAFGKTISLLKTALR